MRFAHLTIKLLYNIYPLKSTMSDYDMDGEEACTLEVNLSYDDVEILE